MSSEPESTDSRDGFPLVLELTLTARLRLLLRLPARSPNRSNAVYFRWLETGRLNFMRVLGSHLQNEQAAKDLSGSGKGKGLILARITFDYRVSLPGLSRSGNQSDICRTVPLYSDQSCSRTMS